MSDVVQEPQEETQRSEEANYRSLFEDSPISLWVEDFSGIKACMDQLRASGVTDFRTYLLEHPEVVRHCISLVKVLDVNRRSVQLYKASSKKELIDSLAKVAGEWIFDSYRDSIAAVAEGKTLAEMEVLNRTLTGEDLYVSSRWSVAPGHEQTYSRVTFSIIDITARKHAEQALRENQRMLATLMSNLPGMAFRCRNDRSWTMEFVSDGCLPLTGYHPSDLVGNRSIAYAQIMHLEDREGVWSQIQAALHEQRPYQLTYRIHTASGQLKWVWEQGRGVYGPDGEVLALEGFSTDITDRKQAEQALDENRKFTQRIIDTNPNLIYIYDLQERRHVYFTPGIRKILGYSQEELLRMSQETSQGLVHPEDIPGILQHLGGFAQAGEGVVREVEYRIRHVQGHWVLLHSRDLLFSRTADGKPWQIIGSAEDVTERRRAQEALRQSEEKYRRLAENAQDVIYCYRLRPALQCEYASPALMAIMGYAPEELYAQPGLLLSEVHPDDREHLERYLQNKLSFQDPVVLRWRHKNGTWVPIELRSTAIYGEAGELVAIEGIGRDIRERQQAEEAMLERASLRELSHRIISSQEEERRRLSRELHDEAGQALTAIKINTELLTKRIPDNLTSLKQLASDTTELTTGLISEMRRIAVALRPAVLEDLGLLPTLRWYTKSVEMRYGLRVKLISRGLKGRLEQSFETTIYRIVQEALTNVVRHAQARHVVVKVVCGKGGLDLAVTDDGKGMDVASIQRGTGLTGIRERAHLFSGTMSLESQAGVGTTLQIRFSVIPEAAS